MRPSPLSVPDLLARITFAAFLISLSPQAAQSRPLVVCDDVVDPHTLDPQREFIEKNHTIVQQIYDGLIRFNADGEIVPALAISWREISPTGTRFELRQGVRFHNGEVFDAEAVKFSIERYLDPNTGFPALGFIRTIKSVEILGPHSVVIHTHVPDALLRERLAGFVMMVPPAYVREKPDGLARAPVGTGAFRFRAWVPGKEIVLERNPDRWGETPSLEGLVFRFEDKPTQLKLLLSGQVDIVTDVPGTETFAIQRSQVARIVKRPSLATVAASFNLSSGPVSSLLVRQALNYALDKEALIRYDLLGNGRPVRSLDLPREKETVDASLNGYSYDPARANALLREAGYPKGFRIRVLEVKATRAAKVIAAYWRRIGIQVTVVSTDDAEIGDQMKKGWDVFLGYCPDPMHNPFFIHSIFLHSMSPYSLTKDATTDRYIEDLMTPGTAEERRGRVRQLVAHVNRNALTLFTYQQVKTAGVRNDVRFQPYLSGMPYFKDTAIGAAE